MPYSAFTDKEHPPSPEEILEALARPGRCGSG